MSKAQELYGLLAEFEDPHALVVATQKAKDSGYRKMDAYTPYPVEEVHEVLDYHHNWVPLICLIGGLTGMAAGFGLEYWSSVIEYPLNIGGRPYFSWPSFVPPAYETTILFAALSCVVGMFVLNGFPAPYHPLFNVPRFKLASRNRFFLCIEAEDPKFDRAETAAFLESLSPTEVSEVAP